MHSYYASVVKSRGNECREWPGEIEMKRDESRERACRRARTFGKNLDSIKRRRAREERVKTQQRGDARANRIPEIIASRGGASKSAAASHKGGGAERGRVCDIERDRAMLAVRYAALRYIALRTSTAIYKRGRRAGVRARISNIESGIEHARHPTNRVLF